MQTLGGTGQKTEIFSTSYLIFVIVLIVSASIAAIIIYQAGKTPKNIRKMRREERYIKLYIKLEAFPLTTKRIRKIAKKLYELSVLNQREVRTETTKLWIKGMLITIALTAAGLMLFDDVVSMLICGICGVSASDIFIEKQVDKTTRKVYNCFRVTISSIREEYLRLGSVGEALAECECDNMIKGIIDDIANILSAANSEILIKEFFERVPFRPVQTLAMVCYRTSDRGDEELPSGETNFMRALKSLSEDVTAELEKRYYIKHAFGKIEYICLVPIIGINLIEVGFTAIIPGLSVVYKGTGGYIIKLVVLLTSVIGYTIIGTINNSNPIKEDDRNGFVNSLLMNKTWENFIYGLEAKNDKKRKLEKKLDKALSKKSVSEFYSLKVLYSVGTFIGLVLTVALVVQIGKDFMKTNTQALSLIANNDLEKYDVEQILEMDNDYIKKRDAGKDLKLEKGIEFVGAYFPELNTLQCQDQLDRMETKYSSLKKAYYHWWYTLLCFLGGVFAWFIPNIILRQRTKLVENEEQEDFLQIQSLMGTIANTNCDNPEALELMCQVSKIHKGILLYCYLSYESNPELELARLESKTNLADFKRFIQKMKVAISDLSLKESFSDLEIERQFILSKRKTAIYDAVDSRRSMCGLISKAPAGLLVAGMLLLPVIIVGVKQLVSAISSLGDL